MYAVIGIVILLVMVFGGFAITGGALGPVMHAIPHEMLIIGGAAVGALVTGNSLHGLKALGGGFKKVFKGPRHTKQDHIDAIVLTTKLMKLLRAECPRNGVICFRVPDEIKTAHEAQAWSRGLPPEIFQLPAIRT